MSTHQHRSGSLKQKNKSHKGSATSKRESKRQSGGGGGGGGNTSSAAAKPAARARLASSQARKQRREDITRQARSKQQQHHHASRIILIVALGEGCDVHRLPQLVANNSQDTEKDMDVIAEDDNTPQVISNISPDQLGKLAHGKTGLQFVVPQQSSRNDIPATLRRVIDAAKVADMVVFQLPVNHATPQQGQQGGLNMILDNAIDALGRTLISVIKTLGLPTCMGAIENLDLVAEKHHAAAKRHCVEWFHQEISPDAKVHELIPSNRDAWIRTLTETGLKHVTWRQGRSLMLCESVEMESSDNSIITVSGVLRGQPLSVNQLVHLCGHGTFAILHASMSSTNLPSTVPSSLELVDTMVRPTHAPGPVVSLAQPDIMAGEQTWPTMEEMNGNADGNNDQASTIDEGREYLKAWGVDELDDEEGDNAVPPVTMSFDDPLQEKRKQAQMDLEFPDEMDTPGDVPARERFVKYRGLKSFRSSPWNPRESLPREYGYIYDLKDFKRIQQQVLRAAADVEREWTKSSTLPDATYLPPGVFIRLTLQVSSPELAQHICASHDCEVLVLGGLLEHENKLSVVNASLRPAPSGTDAVVASRDELELHVGLWRKLCRPTFSEPNLNSDKYKMERFLAPSRWTVASAYAPVTFGTNVPAMLFTKDGELVACGSLDSVDPNRIVLKKTVLSGHPFRVKKRWAVIRKMFYSPEDVQWFRPIEIYTKMGARGKILESVGTHGRMKVLFDRNISQADTVCMDLYKRVFPKVAVGDVDTFHGVDLGGE